MKNIQVRVEDSLKEKSDKLFKALGTRTNEAIKIFLNMSVNKNGFPFAIQMEKIHTLEEWLEEKTAGYDIQINDYY
ncbi:type II toxin-antitoxin system RelB/DinJ family antitoxin [Gracilibacillus alcaliphilus]|uniref:type II toxin-antitoxin system RelB/DinJ family antitoxin n=1 Tax=Gracilibacillus alcaliphilus TaxID=1401441 RepID=UPI00195E5B29|nr:type II toxin-antitoxin system RelB/DinJ family antitoxin [Gracilibacillus alcaliphilus]MBM7677490.1 addiction module RelB/DinJ family antitoxin [Gracilibacillus alcaliphilus]